MIMQTYDLTLFDIVTYRVYRVRMKFLGDVLKYLDVLFDSSNSIIVYRSSSFIDSGEKIAMQNCKMVHCFELSSEETWKISEFFDIIEEMIKESILLEEYVH